MFEPSLAKFKALSAEGNYIPVFKEVSVQQETALSIFQKLKDSKYSALLESVEGGEKWARYSYLSFDPSLVIKASSKEVELIRGDSSEKYEIKGDVLQFVKNQLEKYKVVQIEGLPRFIGGFLGYLSYDVVRSFEKLPELTEDDLELPEALLMLTSKLVIFDNVSSKIQFIQYAEVDENKTEDSLDKVYSETCKSLDGLIECLLSDLSEAEEVNSTALNPTTEGLHPVSLEGFDTVFSNTSKQEYEEAVTKVIDYIAAGDAIQVVISQRFQKATKSSAFEIYSALRKVNPSPYMYCLKFDDLYIAGSSPEVLVRLEDEKLELRPIAGTVKRGLNDEEDKQLAEELLADPKERAEHVMLVDLGRNDLGRVAETASVEVSDFMFIEKYSHVMHIVSNVVAKLRESSDMFDVFRSCFPAGTLSGAPKIRAMEIIEELEKSRRGPYGGAIGFFSFNGNMDVCITIRTVVLKENTAYIQAGAGVVFDSVPEKEYIETVNKASAMFRAIELAERGDSE